MAISLRALQGTGKVGIVDYAKKIGIIISTDMKKPEMIAKILAEQNPEADHEGIMLYARKIKFEADMDRGTRGVLKYLKVVYPKLSEEDVLSMARTVQLT